MYLCEFKSFTPDEFLDLYADAMLRRVMEYAPYESTSRAVVERVGGRYRASIEVHTAQGLFLGQAADSEPKVALDEAEDQIYRQLDEWRQHRFEAA